MTSGLSLDALAATLVDSFRGGFDAPLIEALRARADELAVATGGVPVVIEVALTGMRNFRVGILSDGQLQVPIGTRGPVQFRVQGDPQKVARFALGEGTLLDAQASGLLVFGSPRPATARLIGRLRRLVADELRVLLHLPVVIAVSTRRWMTRLQPIDHPLAEAAYLANCVVTVMLAVCSAVNLPATASTTDLATGPVVQAAPDTTDSLPVAEASSPARPTALTTPSPRRPAPSPPVPREQASTRRTEITTSVTTPHGGNDKWTVITVDCEHRTGRLVCAALQHVPPPNDAAQPSPTAVPGQAGR